MFQDLVNFVGSRDEAPPFFKLRQAVPNAISLPCSFKGKSLEQLGYTSTEVVHVQTLNMNDRCESTSSSDITEEEFNERFAGIGSTEEDEDKEIVFGPAAQTGPLDDTLPDIPNDTPDLARGATYSESPVLQNTEILRPRTPRRSPSPDPGLSTPPTSRPSTPQTPRSPTPPPQVDDPQVCVIKLRRMTIVPDMIQAFMDQTIINKEVKVEFKDEFGY